MAGDSPDGFSGRTNADTLRHLAAAGALSAGDGARLREAWELWTRVHALRQLGEPEDGRTETPAALEPQFRNAVGAGSGEELQPLLESAAASVSAVEARVFGKPGPD